jgi:hypothetical protein
VDIMSRFRTALVLPLLVLAVFMAAPAAASANGGCKSYGCAQTLTVTRAELVMDLMNQQFINVTGTVRCDSVGPVTIAVTLTDEVTHDVFGGVGSPKCVTQGESIAWLVTVLNGDPGAGARPGDLATAVVVVTGATIATPPPRSVVIQQYS